MSITPSHREKWASSAARERAVTFDSYPRQRSGTPDSSPHAQRSSDALNFLHDANDGSTTSVLRSRDRVLPQCGSIPRRVHVTARNKLAREAATYLVAGVLVSATACHYTAFEHFAEWSQVHEVWRAEEIITVLFVVAVLVTIFAVRRLVDATREAGDRERAEKNLRVSERRFVKAFEASPYPMLVMDTKSQVILEANQELVALT
ncbi:MAG TPA: hypothetical protein VN717_02190, partial [Gemmatimonadaceae bacterium]|nr:hypothetical protein [Gemmatimonadaceae bacterium]